VSGGGNITPNDDSTTSRRNLIDEAMAELAKRVGIQRQG
jgi:hypothetical protein